MKTYVVEGGIGKNIMFTALLPSLKKRDGDVQIYTPYISVFANNPYVRMAYDSNTIPLNDSRILASDEIVFREPYKSNFQKGQQHLIESYCDLLEIDYEKTMKPKLYSDYLQKEADEILDKVKKPFVIVQMNGGQTSVGFDSNQAYQNLNPGRNYPPYFANIVVDMLSRDFTVLNWSLPNEQQYSNATPLHADIGILHRILLSEKCKGFISIDSSLQHTAAAANRSGVVIWGNTHWKQYGYDHNSNLSFHESVEYDHNDPRNIMVEPSLVVKTFLENHYDK